MVDTNYKLFISTSITSITYSGSGTFSVSGSYFVTCSAIGSIYELYAYTGSDLVGHYPICESSGINIYNIAQNNYHAKIYYGTVTASSAQATSF